MNDLISSQCLDSIIEENMVITCNSPIFPHISNTFLSSDDVQNHIIEEPMCNEEVQDSFEYVQIHMPFTMMCVNWKSCKKFNCMNLKDSAFFHSEKHVKSIFRWKSGCDSHGRAYGTIQIHVEGR